MGGAAISVISGLVAKKAAKKILIDVLFSAALDMWSKRRAKKAAKNQQSYIQQSSQGPSSRVAAGNAVPIIFGTALLGGDVFDSLTPSDGGWPVYGAIGYCRPKDFSVGVELLSLVDGEPIPVQDDGFIHSVTTPAIFEAIKIGNDSKKKANNATFKYFPKGGFTSSTNIEPLEITNTAIMTVFPSGFGAFGVIFGLSTSPTPAIQNGDEFVILKPDGTVMIFPLSFLRGPSTVTYDPPTLENDKFARDAVAQYYTRFVSGPLSTTPSVVVTRDPVNYRYIVAETGTPTLNNFVASYMLPAYMPYYFRANGLTFAQYISTYPSALVPAGSKLFIWRYEGQTRQPDDVLRQTLGSDLKSNNHLAYMAVEIRDPGVAMKEVIHGVPTVVALVRDNAMPYANTYFTIGNGFTASSSKHTNPFAIIFEILHNPALLGQPIETSDLDAFRVAYNACEALDENGNKRWAFDGYVLTDRVRGREAINEILEIVHGGYYDLGKFTPLLFTGSETPVLTVNMTNLTRKVQRSGTTGAGSSIGQLNFKAQYQKSKEKFNKLNVRYIKPERDYVADYYLTVVDYADMSFTNQEKEKNVDMLMFFTDYYPKKSALIRMDRERKENMVFEGTVDADGLDLELGQIIRLQAFGSDSDGTGYSVTLHENTISSATVRLKTKPSDFITNVGSEITIGANTYIIEDLGTEMYKGTMTEYYVLNDTVFFDDDQAATVTVYNGIKQLLNDTYARIIELKLTPEFDIAFTARKYEPSCYAINNPRFQLVEPRIPDLRKIEAQTLQPPKPIFLALNVEAMNTVDGTIRRRLVAVVGGRSFPNVERTVVTFMAENYAQYYDHESTHTDGEGVLGSVTLYRGQSNAIIDVPMDSDTSGGENLRIYALAVSFNSNHLPSDEADSRQDIVDGDSNPIYPETGIEELLVPVEVEFLDAECIYGTRLRIVSKVYDQRSIAGLELRTNDTFVYHASTDEDEHFRARSKRQIIFEQNENLPDARSLTFYLRAFNSVGNYSEESDSITVTDSIPLQIPTGNVNTTVAGNTVFIEITPYDSGNYERDVTKYSLWEVEWPSFDLVKVLESTSPTFQHTIPYNRFPAGQNTYQVSYKVLAHDRLTDILDDGVLSNTFTIEYKRINSADLELTSFKNQMAKQLLRLGGWGDSNYVNSLGEVGFEVVNETKEYLLNVDPTQPYVLSFGLKNDSLIFITITDGGSGIIAQVWYTDPNNSYLRVTIPFNSHSGSPTTLGIKFQTTGTAQINKVMLNPGDLPMDYILHDDDMPVSEKYRQIFDKLANQGRALSDRLRDISQVLVDQGASIEQRDYGISLRVRKDNLLSEINLSTEGVAIRGDKVIIDGATKFINTSGTFFGYVVDDLGDNVWRLSQSSVTSIPSSGVIYVMVDPSTAPADPDTWSDPVTFSVLSRDAEKFHVVVELSGGGLSEVTYGKFFSSTNSSSVTQIDGGRIMANTIQSDHIQANSISADKILAETIGTDKLIAKKVLTDLLEIYGLNNIIIDPREGIHLFHNNNVVDNSGSGFVASYNSSLGGFLILSATFSTSIQAVEDDYLTIITGSNFDGVSKRISEIDVSSVPSYTLIKVSDFSSPDIADTSLRVGFVLRGMSGGSSIRLYIDNTGTPTIGLFQGTSSTPLRTKLTSAGLSIGEGDIKLGAGDTSFNVNSDGDLWIGNEDKNLAPFFVDKTGSVKAFQIALEVMSKILTTHVVELSSGENILRRQILEKIKHTRADIFLEPNSGGVYIAPYPTMNNSTYESVYSWGEIIQQRVGGFVVDSASLEAQNSRLNGYFTVPFPLEVKRLLETYTDILLIDIEITYLSTWLVNERAGATVTPRAFDLLIAVRLQVDTFAYGFTETVIHKEFLDAGGVNTSTHLTITKSELESAFSSEQLTKLNSALGLIDLENPSVILHITPQIRMRSSGQYADEILLPPAAVRITFFTYSSGQKLVDSLT